MGCVSCGQRLTAQKSTVIMVGICCLCTRLSVSLDAVTEGYVRMVEVGAPADRGAPHRATSSRVPREQDRPLRVETLSVDPPVFVIDDLLDDADCEALVSAALRQGLQPQPRHLGLGADQAFFLRPPAPGSLWQLWRSLDSNGDGHANAAELRDFVQRRWHLQAFSLEDASKLLREAHELGMPAMSRRAFASYDWESLLAERHSQAPEQFARYGTEAELRPGGPEELPAMRRLRARVARMLGWLEDDVMPDYGEPLKIIRYPTGVGGTCRQKASKSHLCAGISKRCDCRR